MNENVENVLKGAVSRLRTTAIEQGVKLAVRDAAREELTKRSSEGGDLMVFPGKDTPQDVEWKKKVHVDLQGMYALGEQRLDKAERECAEAGARLDGMLTILTALLSEPETF